MRYSVWLGYCALFHSSFTDSTALKSEPNNSLRGVKPWEEPDSAEGTYSNKYACNINNNHIYMFAL